MSVLPKIPLVAGVPAHVMAVAPCDSDRFVRVFGQVWSRLPDWARQALLGKWQRVSAIVHLTNRWEEQAGRVAQCSLTGSQFHFLADSLALMSDEVLAACIAHELAHAYFYSANDPYHCGNVLPEDVQRRLAESLGRELADVWGYPPRVLGQWCVQNREWLEANASSRAVAAPPALP